MSLSKEETEKLKALIAPAETVTHTYKTHTRTGPKLSAVDFQKWQEAVDWVTERKAR